MEQSQVNNVYKIKNATVDYYQLWDRTYQFDEIFELMVDLDENDRIMLWDLKEDIGQFAKGVILMLCDKFVTNESMNRTISNLVGGNMKIVEDYAQRVAQQKVDEKLEEKNKKVIINLNKKGFEAEEIAETVDVSIDFVNKVLAK